MNVIFFTQTKTLAKTHIAKENKYDNYLAWLYVCFCCCCCCVWGFLGGVLFIFSLLLLLQPILGSSDVCICVCNYQIKVSRLLKSKLHVKGFKHDRG